MIQFYFDPILANSPEYIRAQVKFARRKLHDMDLKNIVNTIGRWKELEEKRLRSISKENQKKEQHKRLKEMIGSEGRVIEISDILDSWVRKTNMDYFKFFSLNTVIRPVQ